MASRALLHPFARPTEVDFISIVGGEGSTVRDSYGRTYIDAMASLWYCQVGHGRAEIIDAITAQLHTLDAFHTFEKFTNPPADALADRLAQIAPMADARVFLTSSGSEAVETALKLARLHWSWQGHPERCVVISRDRGYHGVGYGGTTAQGLAPNREHWGPLLGDVVHTDADDLEDVAAAFAEHEDRVAAVIAEPVQGAAGVWPPAPGYLNGLRELCDEYGSLLIFDEVVCAFGRLGEWWGADHFGVTPDLVTFAKGATSGYQPLGGVLVGAATRAVLEADHERWFRHGFTYSGHPAACAAALANIDLIEAEGLAARASHIADELGAGLAELVEQGAAASVRGAGGLWAITLPDETSAREVRDHMLGSGVIARPIGEHSIAYCPPLVVTDQELAQILESTSDALRAAR
ncbi:MAG: aspartate aminotransferase family protein [Actinomycetia bacterium]|nr:aspartate aminotransferase family protein [Actinomycetes bacterium]